MVDRAKVFQIDENASTIIIGNPFIADAAMHNGNTVVITGKSYGTTNLVILDSNNNPIVDEVISVTAANTDGVVSVFRNAARQTFSCQPNCQPALQLGDQTETFDATAQQAVTRNDLAVGAATGQN